MGGHSQKKARMEALQKKQERELASRKFKRFFWSAVVVGAVAIGISAAIISKPHHKQIPFIPPVEKTVPFSEAMGFFDKYLMNTGKKYDEAAGDREANYIANVVVMSLVGEMKAPRDDSSLAQFAMLIKNSLSNDRYYPDLNALPDDYSIIKLYAQKIDSILLANKFKKISIELAADYLKTNKQVADISPILKQRLVYIGDRHDSHAVREEVINLLPSFRKAGFTHIGMEAYSDDIGKEFDEDVAICKSNLERLTPILANPSLTQKNREVLEQDKESIIRDIDLGADLKRLWQTALKLGFRVVPIDTNVTVEVAEQDNEGRERVMASKISRVIADQQNKMLVFIGGLHLKKSQVPAKVTGITGVHGISIDMNTEFRVQANSEVTLPGTTLMAAIQREGLESEKFILPIYPKWGDYDYLYHIPQNREYWVPTGPIMHMKLKTPQLGKLNYLSWINMLTSQQEYSK